MVTWLHGNHSGVNEISEQLWLAYQATSFEADLPTGLVRIRVGRPCPGVDEQLKEVGLQDWAFITAFNPASVPQSEPENQQRHVELQRVVASLGLLAFEGAGVPDNSNWKPERSLLILGITLEDAVALGRQFGQNAIVTGSIGKSAELVVCH